jgi:hypothetical protein
VPDNLIRSELWLIASGAKRELKNNPGYYNYLVHNYPSEIELPSDKQIDLVIFILIDIDKIS